MEIIFKKKNDKNIKIKKIRIKIFLFLKEKSTLSLSENYCRQNIFQYQEVEISNFIMIITTCTYFVKKKNLFRLIKYWEKCIYGYILYLILVIDRKRDDIEGWTRLGSRRTWQKHAGIFNARASRYLVPILSEVECPVYPPSRYYPLE